MLELSGPPVRALLGLLMIAPRFVAGRRVWPGPRGERQTVYGPGSGWSWSLMYALEPAQRDDPAGGRIDLGSTGALDDGLEGSGFAD